jgi:post-segregation antitoxin (ccd killing protein)
MNSRLVNVRLDEQRLERARRLRAKGIALSDLVRDAIDRQYEQLVKSSARRDVEGIMKQIYEQYPDSPGLPPRNYDVHRRDEARSAVLRKLRHKR